MRLHLVQVQPLEILHALLEEATAVAELEGVRSGFDRLWDWIISYIEQLRGQERIPSLPDVQERTP